MGRKVILDDAEQVVPTQDFAIPTGSIREVEEAIAVDENDIGTSQHPRVKDEAEDVEMVDNDAPDAGVDMEVDVPPEHNRTASPSPTPQKRRRSGNAKPGVTEENDSRTPNRSALTRLRAQSQVEVVVPPRPDYASSRKDSISPPKIAKSASRKLVTSEPSTTTKKSTPVKVKTLARKSVVAVEEEEEPTSTKRPSPKTQKRKRDESEEEEEEEEELPEKPIPGPSKLKPTRSTRTVQRRAQESSPPAANLDDVPSRGRRSAAQKADEKLKDIMPDVINFEKQMKRGAVVGEWEKAQKEQERADKKAKEKEKSKENAGEKKVKEKAQKKRRSDVRYDSLELALQQTQLYRFNCSAKEEEEEEDDEPGVHIMATKVQVSEDTKKVRSSFRRQ